MNTEVMFSHKKNNWATPQWFFDKLDDEFHFTLMARLVVLTGQAPGTEGRTFLQK